jgi:hypothetical protein
MDRRHHSVRLEGQEGEQLARTMSRARLGAAHSSPGPPHAGEDKERPVLASANQRGAAALFGA